MTTIDLNGTWDFVADLDPKYHAIHGGFQSPAANRRHWQPVPVPGVWQNYGERYEVFEGVCWFVREFEAPAAARARLRFGGVNYLAAVYLNGEPVGTHEGGYTEFTVDVSGKLRGGTNHLAVQVDNRATTIKWPPCLGYFNYGGIHRGVRLEILDAPHLDDVRLNAADELCAAGQATGGARVRVHAAGRTVTVPVAAGAFTATTGIADVPAWSPESPHLFPVVVELLDAADRVLDRREYAGGRRTLTVRDGRLRLNGAPYRLQGICYVYDAPATGLVMTPEEVATDLQLMKDAGANAVRCHYPMDKVFYAACDHVGLLVWTEPPVYCYHPADAAVGTRFADPEWLALAQSMAREMIAVARNHPSVAIYSIGNECNTRNPEAEPFFRALAATIRETDPTRLLSYAALYGNVGPLADIVDVLGVNSYWGWYDRIGDPAAAGPPDLGPMRQMLDDVLAHRADLALLLTEFGADSVPGARGDAGELWTEDYHADLLRRILALAAEYPAIVGTFPFGFSDYRDPSKVHNGYWNELNLKGIVDYHRRRKAAYAAVREAYNPTTPEAAP